MFILSLATGTHLPYTGISNEVRTHNITGADLWDTVKEMDEEEFCEVRYLSHTVG